jgi:hypothetical protein
VVVWLHGCTVDCGSTPHLEHLVVSATIGTRGSAFGERFPADASQATAGRLVLQSLSRIRASPGWRAFAGGRASAPIRRAPVGSVRYPLSHEGHLFHHGTHEIFVVNEF